MFIDIDGIKVNYKVTGSGRNVILMHGWGCQIKTFEPVHNHLEKYFRTYSLDFPGFGESDLPPEPWGVEEYSAVMQKFIKKLEIDRPILIGHSNGGRIALHLAATSGIPLNKMILTGCAGIKPKRSIKYYIKVYSYKLMKNILRLPPLRPFSEKLLDAARSRLGSDDYKSAPDVLRKTLVKLVNSDIRHLLPSIKVSALLVWGENDTATPISDGKLMEKLIPDAGLVVFKDAGHFAYLEKLNQFLIVIDNFLKDDMKSNEHDEEGNRNDIEGNKDDMKNDMKNDMEVNGV